MNWEARLIKCHDQTAGSSVEANFRADYVEAAQEFLRLADVRIPLSFSDEDISRAYWNTRSRWIEARPRTVHLATNLLVATPNNEGLTQLKNKFEEGADVNPHQSKALGDANHSAFHDLLFNDWGIQHFHLGERKEGMRFAERTDQLLFALVKPDDVYFVAILPHGAWVELGLLETIHATWPSVLTKAVGIEGSDLTEEQRRTLRKKHCNVLPKLKDGTTYMPLGGGYRLYGLWSEQSCPSAVGSMYRGRSAYQRSIEQDAVSIAQQISEGSGRQVGSPMIVRMELDDGEAFAVEETAKVRFHLGPFPPPIRG